MDGRNSICSVAFLADGMHVVSGGLEGKIRCWQMEDGREVGAAMDAGGRISNLAVSRDGTWIVSGTQSGVVRIWSVESHEKVREIKGHTKAVWAIDISPDATRIVTGSDDSTACVWSIASGERLLNPLKHDDALVAVKYSSNGDLIATATWSGKFVRVYKSQDGSLLFDSLPISVNSVLNQSLAWSVDNKHLFALSENGSIYCLDMATGATYSEWAIHSSNKPRCIALASNGMFIAASANSSVSFWDPLTHKQIGGVFQYGDAVRSVSISLDNSHLASGGDDKKITLRSLRDVLPQIYFVDVCSLVLQRVLPDMGLTTVVCSWLQADPREPEIRRMRKEQTELEKTNKSLLAIIRAHEQKHQCEALYAAGNTKDAAESLCKFVDATSDEVKTNKLIMDWISGEFWYLWLEWLCIELLLSEFTKRCVAKLQRIGDAASNAKKDDEAIAAYSTALSLSSPKSVLVKWVNMLLMHGSVNEALNAATKVPFPISYSNHRLN